MEPSHMITEGAKSQKQEELNNGRTPIFYAGNIEAERRRPTNKRTESWKQHNHDANEMQSWHKASF